MALSSQTSRQSGSLRRYSGRRSAGMSRRRRRRQRQLRVVVAFALLFGAIGLVWMWTQGGVEPSETLAASDESRAGEPASAAEGDNAPISDRSPASAALSSPLPDRDEQSVIASSNARRPGATEKADRTPEDAAVITMGELVQAASSGDLGPTLEAARQARESTEGARPDAQNSGHTPTGAVASTIAKAKELADSDRPLAARDLYNQALWDQRATEEDRALLRRRLSELNATLIFSPAVIDGDPLAKRYVVQSGDFLSSIARRESAVDWQFIQRINRISDPARIRVGQTIKIVTGPFHAVVDKSAFRMDLYAGPAPALDSDNRLAPLSSGELPIYITSVPVGLGEYGSTPVGSWLVNDTKVINPAWKNPRTGEFFAKDDPENPVGERWIGITGTDDETAVLSGYGIHGTIEPESIGEERSMGCVRLNPFDVELVYELMRPDRSVVLIVE